MTRRRLLACFGIALLLAGLLLMPLSLAIRALGYNPNRISAIEAAGTVWRGSLREASWRGRAMGDLSLALRPLPLLGGVRHLRVAGNEFSLSLLTGRVVGVADGQGELMIDDIGVPGASARIFLQQSSMRFTRNRCRSAGGTVRVLLVLPALPSGISLAGPLACAGDVGRVVLVSDPAGAPAPVVAESVFEISGDGRYRLQSLVRSDDPSVRVALQLAGFQDSPTGLSRVDSGRLGD